MRKTYVTILFILATSFCLTAEELKSTWLTSYNQALEHAGKAPNKKIFMLFTGSDWCPACIQLHDTILKTDTFKKYAAKNLILMLVDFPQRKPQMPIQRQINEKLALKFKAEAFPTILLLDSKGKVLKNIDFEGQSPKEFIKELEKPALPKVSALKSKRRSYSCGSLTPDDVYSMVKFPPVDKTYTQRDYLKKKYAWLKKLLVDAPLTAKKFNKETALFLDDYCKSTCQIEKAPSLNELRKTGKRLYNSGIDSPFFLSCYLGIVREKDNRKFYRTLHRLVRNKLFSEKNLPSFLLFNYALQTKRKPSNYLMRWLKKGDFKDVPPRIMFHYISWYIEDKSNELQKAVDLLKKMEADPWLQIMAQGYLEWTSAWEDRGGGFSYTVTRKGANGFKVHGKKAYELYQKAYELHPERPESSGQLVYVCCCQTSKTEALKWFNRALAAQIDFKQPWVSMMWGLRPRWCGSWPLMLALGRKATQVNQKFYFTLVPMVFVWSVLDISGEMKIPQRKKFMQEMLPEVTKILMQKKTICDKSGNQSKSKKLLAILGKYQLFCGDYSSAAKNLKLADPDDNGFTTLACDNLYFQTSRPEMDEEIKLATGPHAAKIKQIDQLIESGEKIEAAQKFVEIMKEMKTPAGKLFAKNRAVSLFLANKRYIPESDKGIFALARGSSLEGVKAFLDAGCKVNCRGWHNCTLLQCSLKKDSDYYPDSPKYAKMKIDMLRFLLSRGADINALAGPKWTALHLSISNKLPIPVVDFILKQKGVNINCGDCDKETPLMWCAMLNLTKQAKFLLSKGADPNLKDRRGKRAIDYAKSPEMRQILSSI